MGRQGSGSMYGAAMGEWPWHWWNVLLTMTANAITFDMAHEICRQDGMS